MSHCKGCGKRPEEIKEYRIAASESGETPEEFVRTEEGTYNPRTERFYCTACYIAAGMPLGIADRETPPGCVLVIKDGETNEP